MACSASTAYALFLPACRFALGCELRLQGLDRRQAPGELRRHHAIATTSIRSAGKTPAPRAWKVGASGALGASFGGWREREKSEAVDIRDRMWTLLRRRYEHLRQAGVVVFGLDALDANVPPLGSRAYLAPKAAPQDKPASEPAGKPATEAPKPTGAAPTP